MNNCIIILSVKMQAIVKISIDCKRGTVSECAFVSPARIVNNDRIIIDCIEMI